MIAFAAVAAALVAVIVAFAAVGAGLVGVAGAVVAAVLRGRRQPGGVGESVALVCRPFADLAGTSAGRQAPVIRSWRVSVPVERQLAKIAGPRVVG
ncbi:hypothetical protein [Micromonospora sp. NPDC005299]|uniref:hypothetical protein n=1 Tax=Micromonospora sp. NPDC005299 TaxID=3364231 RepID=UPI00369BD7F9